MEVLAVM